MRTGEATIVPRIDPRSAEDYTDFRLQREVETRARGHFVAVERTPESNFEHAWGRGTLPVG